MRGTLLALFVAVLPAATGRTAPAPCDGGVALTNPDAFVACARGGTEKYRDHDRAVLDGYRRIGSDFPGMGEHWIRVSLVFDGAFDPSRPEVLNYIPVDGTRHLVGVAYAVPLLDGERPPDGPAGPHAWHDHSRTITDETVLPHHMHGSSGSGSRLAMLHAWIWSPNPEGTFAADNWAIPFLRLGLASTAHITAPMGKALALAAGGREYFDMAIDAGATLSTSERLRVQGALDAAQKAVEPMVRELKAEDALARGKLAEVWRRLWADMESAVSDDARQQLARLPIR